MSIIKDFWQLLKNAGSGFSQHKVLKLSASLCFYTIFSLGPMMLVIIYISSLFWGRQAIEGSIYSQISGVIGNDAATQIQDLIKEASERTNAVVAVIGITTLLFAATTVFTEMHDSMNTIWNLKVRKGKGFMQMLKNRLIAFSLITGLGFLLLVLLILNGLLEGFMQKLQEMFPDIAFAFIYAINLVLTLLIVAMLFAFIFKILPDAIIKWKDVVVGALFTAVLFMIGKFGFSFYIKNTNMGDAYGSAGSLVVLLLWVFYSATVLYFGAEFTKAYTMKYSDEIKPKDYAVTIKVVRVESNESSVQKNEKNMEIKT